MKKNIAMRVAAFLFILTMISTCAFATTFAKYTTHAATSDTARVAHWGIEITAHAENSMFSKTEGTSEGESILTVKSLTEVVAPGTSGSFIDFDVEGQPEVAARVSFEATVDLGDNWVGKDGNYYCPIEVTVSGAATLKGTSYNSVDDFEAAIKAAIEANTWDYEAGTQVFADGLDISWKWAFTGNDDVKDTYLGDQAAAGNAASILLKVDCIVTQID